MRAIAECLQTLKRKNSFMDKHTLELIEFDKITEELSSYCFSEEASDVIQRQDFFYDAGKLSAYLDLVDDFEYLLSKKTESISAFCPSTRKILEKLGKEGTVLDEEELSSIRKQLISGRMVKQFITGAGDEGETIIHREADLYQRADAVPGLRRLEKIINEVITPEGQVNEKLPSLQAIRKRITKLNSEISSIAGSYLHNPKYRNYIQDQTPGQKDGRTVLPIKSQHKQKIEGLVQDISASGATIFIEPYDLVEKNNDLAIEKGKYRQEVHRILQDLSDNLREYVGEIDEMRTDLLDIDAVYSRARYSRIHGCSRVEITESEVDLQEAIHPLLGKSAVPVRILVGAEVSILVISGPNTGGKTVALKTAGIISAMHQYGMKLPVLEGSRLPVFSDIFTDIGDEQSIDLSLSTFSGHMKRISGICKAADKHSLVLLDELGSGTDAVEGGALAMAVLDHLSELKCKSIVTTHQSSLKNYAFGKETAENASVEFDLAELRPTFRLLNGVPGESHALEIAEMMGMDTSIMETAKEYQRTGLSDINTIIRQITKTRQELLTREEELQKTEDEYRKKQKNLEEREEKLQQEQEKLHRGDVRELQEFTDETRKKLENMIRELREGEILRSKTKKAKQFIGELEQRLSDEAERKEETEYPIEPVSGEKGEFHQGMEVLYTKNRKKGTLIRKKKQNRWLLAVGNLKIEVGEDEVSPLKSEKAQAAAVDYSAEKVQIPMEMDIRGMRYDEAQTEIRKYVDNAVLQGMERLEVIHGKGEGILQDAVRKVLEELPVVEDFSFAPPEAGGFGKTVVVLRKSQ